MDERFKQEPTKTTEFESVPGGEGVGHPGVNREIPQTFNLEIIAGVVIAFILFGLSVGAAITWSEKKRVEKERSNIVAKLGGLVAFSTAINTIDRANQDLAKKIESGEYIKVEQFKFGNLDVYVTKEMQQLLERDANGDTGFDYTLGIQQILDDITPTKVLANINAKYLYNLESMGSKAVGKYPSEIKFKQIEIKSPDIIVKPLIATKPKVSILVDCNGKDPYRKPTYHPSNNSDSRP
jgi:hypothetical protein